MTSRTEIINRALVKVGTQRIAAPTDPTEQARITAEVFPSLAKSELRKHAWSFSLKRANLAALGPPPINSFLISYALPADLLRLVYLNDQWVAFGLGPAITEPDVPAYSIEGRNLVTRNGTAVIRYVADLSIDTSLWDATFIEAFACRLAQEVAPSLTKDKQKVQMLKQDYADAIKEAKRCNAIELPPQEIPDGSWVTSRFI